MSLNWDTLGKLITELRADADVAAIVGANPTASPPRVAGFEPRADWAQGPGHYRAFVVLVNEGTGRMRRVPIQRPRYIARCYGRTPEEAAALAVAVSDACHERGSRVYGNGLGIYRSFVDSGGDQDRDPDTRQPLVVLFIDLIATTQVVTA